MRRFTFANLALWAIAVVTTVFLVPDRGVLTYLGPVYAVCAIGSTTIIRKTSGSDGSRPGSWGRDRARPGDAPGLFPFPDSRATIVRATNLTHGERRPG